MGNVSPLIEGTGAEPVDSDLPQYSTHTDLLYVKVAAVLVVLFFMHLRWDSKLFGRLFWAGAILAIAVYTGALATFQYFVKA